MSQFFEHTNHSFICPICHVSELIDNKCFIMIRQKHNKPSDGRKDLICKSTSCCKPCYTRIEQFIDKMAEKRK